MFLFVQDRSANSQHRRFGQLRCLSIGARTVDPEDEGGYISWHRDMPDVQSASCLFPTDRVVKVILYLHDLPAVSPAFFLYEERVLEVLLRV